MATPLLFPMIGGTSQATLSGWVPEDGDLVGVGELLYYVELGDVIEEISSPAAGRLRTVGSAGMTYRAGEVIGSIE